MSRKAERPFWVPYCGYGPGWCVKTCACPGRPTRQYNSFDEPVRGCSFLRELHPWTGLGYDAFKAIVWEAYHHPLKVKRARPSAIEQP